MGWARARNTAVRSTLTAIRKAYNVQRTRSLSSYLDFLADFAGFVAKKVLISAWRLALGPWRCGCSSFNIKHLKFNTQN